MSCKIEVVGGARPEGVLPIYKVTRMCQHLGYLFHQKRKRKGVFFLLKMQEKGYTFEANMQEKGRVFVQ